MILREYIRALLESDPWREGEAQERQNRLAAARDFPEDLLPNVRFPKHLQHKVPYTPGQRTITIYRSVPPGITEIRPGDWVTLTREYADTHGRGEVLTMEVPVEHVMWAGTDENEWFYTPTSSITESRQKGRSLPETGYQQRYALIYRAQPATDTTIKPMDYVTLSRKFAKEHAQHMAVTEGEDYHMLRAMVPASDVYEAYNPGEYFYDGESVEGKSSFVAKAPTY